MKRYIIGLHIGHDATVVLLENDFVISAVSEERFSRVKNHNGFPYKSLAFLVNEYNISNINLAGIALTSSNPPAPYVTDILFNSAFSNRQLFFSVPDEFAIDYHFNSFMRLFGKIGYNRYCYEYYNKKIKEVLNHLGLEMRVFYFDHHACHAASVYYSAGEGRILLITIDGFGDGLSATVNIGDSNVIRKIYSTSGLHSVGRFYSAFTDYLGFQVCNHEGKITGLAAFGNPEVHYEKIRNLLCLSKDQTSFRTKIVTEKYLWKKLYSLLYAFKRRKNYDCGFESYREKFRKLFSQPVKEDLAAAIQLRLEDVVTEHVQAMMDRFKIYHVGLAGGVFANVKLNQRISELNKIESLFIHPNMGDGGLAFGAAFLLRQKLPYKPIQLKRISDVYLGPQYSEDEIFAAINNKKEILNFVKTKDIEKKIALLLKENKIIALFQGRLEYGPRALGNRSLLADARNKVINDILNKRLMRSEFMPFAPSILEEMASNLLVNYEKFAFAAEFMTLTFNMRPEWINKIPAVVHIDSTVRPQVVSKDINPRLYGIIKEYQGLTGIPAVINTSFNMHESPIVCSPEDAIDDFLKGAADVLVLEDIMVTKKYNY